MTGTAAALNPVYTDGMEWTSLLGRQLGGGTRVADTGTATAVAPLGGVFSGITAAMQVTAPVSGMSVNVGAGYFAVAHPTPGHGVYLSGLMAQSNLTIATASGSHPRIDIVCATINDLGNSSSNAVVQVITGTAATSPVAPSTPAASLLLAQVLVPTSATSIITGDISDERTWTVPPGCVLPVANAAAAPAIPSTQFAWNQATGALCQGTGTAGSLDSVSFLQGGTMKVVNTSTGAQGQTPGNPTSDPWGIGYGQIGSSGGGGGKGGGGSGPVTDGVIATEVKVTWTADGLSDYEVAYRWQAAVPADAWVSGTGVTGGQVQFRLYVDGTEVDSICKVVTDSPLTVSGGGTASWFSSAALGTTPSAGRHTATLSVVTSGTDESGASGVFVGDLNDSASTLFSAPSGWYNALLHENCSLRAQAVQPG